MTALPEDSTQPALPQNGPAAEPWAQVPCAHVTRLVASFLDMPIALLSLPRAEEYAFRANIGLEGYESVPCRISFCAYTMLRTDVLVVPDAREDARFRGNPLVLGEPHIVAYVGAPLISSRGATLGTLCAIDRRPRTFSASQLDQLRDFARLAAWLLEAEAQLQDTVVAERERLAMVLHEGVAQDLFALRLQLQQLSNAGEAAAGTAFSQALDRSINDICDLADGLMPGVAGNSR